MTDSVIDLFVSLNIHRSIYLCILNMYIYIHSIYIYSIYIYRYSIYIYTYTVCVYIYIYVCLNMAGRAKENLPGGSPKQLFVYLKVRIFRCIYIYMNMMIFQHVLTFCSKTHPQLIPG